MQEIMTGWYRPSRSEWLLRPRTIQLVSVAAVWWLLMVVLFLFMAIYSRANVWIIVQNSSRIETILALVCAGGAFAGTFLIVCMLWFWARLDRSRKAWRVLWFLSFLCGWAGVPIYALLVYRKNASELSRNL